MKWTPYLLSLARIVFGFLIVRHGMEQWLAYPEASGAARLSYEGIVELIALPAGLLIMLGLSTRPVALLLSVLYFVLYFAGPLQRGWFTHRNGGDPILLNAFFMLYLGAAGGGAWSLDKWLGRQDEVTRWAPQALGLLRIAAGCLFFMHGLEKFFSVGGGRIDRDILTMRGLAGWLEMVGGPLVLLGLFTRPVVFILSGEMAVAYFRNWAPRGFWQSFQLAGMEASILFSFLYLYLWSAGPGAWSLDGLLAKRRGHTRGGSTMKAKRTALASIAALLLSGVVAQAQWVNRPTPGIPRLPNGKPNLTAPVPPRLPDGHPDLSGIWDVGAMTYFHDLAAGLKGDDAPQLTPWALGLQKGRRDRNHVDDPYTYCMPLGVPRQNHRSAFKIVQTPPMTIFLHESFVGNTFRQIFTDGRPLPKLSETEPAWLGYSVGRWDGDVFVVESIGFRDKGWLSANMAYPNSDALHVIERWRRIDFGHLEETVTIDDPKAYLKPWTNKIILTLQADTEILDSYCDNQMIMQAHYSMGPPPAEPSSPPLGK